MNAWWLRFGGASLLFIGAVALLWGFAEDPEFVHACPVGAAAWQLCRVLGLAAIPLAVVALISAILLMPPVQRPGR